jgi:hypothetical protein
VERRAQLAQAVAAARTHAHAAKIAEVAAEVAARVADARAVHASAADVEQLAARIGLEQTDAETDFGNVLSILQRGAEDPAERAIVAAFVGAGVVRATETNESSARKWAERACYLGAHAGFDPLAALPDGADPAALRPLMRALIDHARRVDQGKVPPADRAELLVAVSALSEAVRRGDAELAQLTSRLAADLSDPLAQRLITAQSDDAPATLVQSGPSAAALQGEIAPPPRNAALTILFTISGWLVVRAIAVFVGRLLLGLKRDARIELNASGIEVRAKTELLGRELSSIHTVFPLNGLSLVRRDVRFPSLHVYVGLIALLFGTYLGVQFLSWGALGGSIRLLSYGFVVLALGVLVDLLLVAIVPGSRGKVRVVLVPKKGSTFCIGGLEAQSADRLVAEIAKRAS